MVCDKIIEAKGCIVPDENFRTGHRARRIHGEDERKTKLRKRDRKSTMHQELPVHPGLKSAYEFLMGSSDAATPQSLLNPKFSQIETQLKPPI